MKQYKMVKNGHRFWVIPKIKCGKYVLGKVDNYNVSGHDIGTLVFGKIAKL